MSGLPLRGKRGRPRKIPTLNHTATAHQPPNFGQASTQTVGLGLGPDTMVGQAVKGVIEASFDSGYLLSVRIGDSNTNLRGVVFKPGHVLPVTTENDMAPRLQMNQREPLVFGGGSQKLTVQRACANGGSGLPFPVYQISELSEIPHAREVDVSFSDGNTSEEGQGEKSKAMASITDVNTHGYSSQTSDINADNEKEVTKPSAEDTSLPFPKDSGITSNQETESANAQFSTEFLQFAPSVTPPFLNFRTGGMTELLQAVQGNARETSVYVAEAPHIVMSRESGDIQKLIRITSKGFHDFRFL